MSRSIVGAFIVAHGLVTAMIWVAPVREDAPFNPAHSWLIGDSRALAMTLAIVAAAGFVLAGVGVIGHQSWWALFGILAGGLALALMAMYFDPWLVAGITISVAILLAAGQQFQAA